MQLPSKEPRHPPKQKDIQVADKLTNRCSLFLVIREMQIKTTVKYQFIPTGITVKKKIEDNKCWQRCREVVALPHCWWNIKWFSRCGKQEFCSSSNELPYDLATLTPGISPKQL